MARKSGFVRRNGVMRRETRWIQGTFLSTTLASTNAVAITTSLSAVGLALRPFTVVRTRGQMHVRADQTSASENYAVQMGFCIVSEQALAIGVTAVPTPDTDGDSDLWYVYESLFGNIDVTTDIGRLESGQSASYDSKAMRKVEDGEQLIQVMECPVSSAIILDSFRMLIKLH